MPIFSALAGAFIISFIPIGLLMFLPGVLPLRKRTAEMKTVPSEMVLDLMLCFAAGSLVGDALLNLLTESMLGDFPSHEHFRRQTMGTVVGIGVFYMIDVITRFLNRDGPGGGDHAAGSQKTSLLLTPVTATAAASSTGPGTTRRRAAASPGLRMLSTGRRSVSPDRPSSGRSIKSSGILNLVADAIHNFTDGLALFASFARDFRLGLSTTIAIFFHEVPHELSDYAILSKAGFTHNQIMLTQIATAGAAFLGVFVGWALHKKWVLWYGLLKEELLLPFAAGGFLYVALCSILPESNDASESRTAKGVLLRAGVFWFGILLMSLLH